MDKEKIIHDSEFINQWKKEMIQTITKMNPSWEKDDINKVLNEMLLKQLQIPKAVMDNNYTGESRETNIISIFDWTLERKPIIAGNGTFYKNQLEAINPVAKMIDDFLIKRKSIKKEMFNIEDPASDLYQDLDRKQQNQKVLCNSYYGGSGMPKSAFYSKWSGPATTGTAQSVISTTETFFESFLVDNYKFIDINECFHYMNLILEQDYDLPDFVEMVDRDSLFNRIVNMFYDDIYRDDYELIIKSYIGNLTGIEVTKIFYKNNFIEFTRRHKKIISLYDKLFSSVKNYKYAETVMDIPAELLNNFTGDDNNKIKSYNNFVNNQFFMDPNSPPDTIKDILKKLDKYYMKCVYMPFMSIDRIYRLKYFRRKTVCIVDTDSNILALDSWVDFCKNEVLRGDYGRSEENNRFIIINALAYFITSAVRDTLNEYGLHSNIPDEYRARFNMKNEFYFNKLVIGRKKKRYISSIKLREGNLLNPYKPDVKGFEYMKATTSEDTKKRFDNIVKKYILESDTPNISAILYELQEFENDIRNSILRGELTYLPLGNAKELTAYKNPYSQQGVRGAIAWNIIYPDRQISFPSKVSILKLNIFKEEDIEYLKNDKYMREYILIKNEIFGSPIKEISSKGLQVLSIPNNTTIPEWCQEYIDYNTVINNIIGQFKGVLDIFGIDSPEVGKIIKSVNRKTRKFSNIVRF